MAPKTKTKQNLNFTSTKKVGSFLFDEDFHWHSFKLIQKQNINVFLYVKNFMTLYFLIFIFLLPNTRLVINNLKHQGR